MLCYSSSSRDFSSSLLSMYFEYFSYFIRLPRSQPRLDDVKKHHKLYPFIIPSDMKKTKYKILFWFAFALLFPCAAAAVLSGSSVSLTVKGEYNHRLFTYLCLFLFVFNYRVMSRGASEVNSNFCYLSSRSTASSCICIHIENSLNSRTPSTSYIEIYIFPFLLSQFLLRMYCCCYVRVLCAVSRLKSDSICNILERIIFNCFTTA